MCRFGFLIAFTVGWTASAAHAGASVSVTSVTVTQGLQDASNSVPMIAGKRTFVQVILDAGGTQKIVGLSGTLEARRPGSSAFVSITSVKSYAAMIDPAWNGKPERRNSLERNLTFELPALWIGPGSIAVRLVSVQDASGGAIACANCEASGRSVTFARSAALRLVLLGMRYRRNGRPIEPRAEDYASVVSWLARTYPVPLIEAEIRVIEWGKAPSTFDDGTCRSLDQELIELRNEDQSDGQHSLQHYYGLVSDGWSTATPVRAFMRGCSYAPANAANLVRAIGSGPVGRSASDLFAWDKSVSYAGWYAAHEIAHTLGRTHVRGDGQVSVLRPASEGCGTEPDPLDSAWPHWLRTGWIGSKDRAYVGFDPGDAQLASPMRIIGWDSGADMMTYCSNQWVSYHTYAALCKRLNQESKTACPLKPDDAPARVAASAAAGPAPLVDREPVPQPGAVPEASSPPEMPPPTGPALAAPKPDSHAPVLSITGQINLDENTGSISVNRLERAVPDGDVTEADSQGTTARTFDAAGKTLDEAPLAVLLNADAPSSAPRIAIVTGEVPYRNDVARVAIMRGGKIVAEQRSSGAPPQISRPTAELPKLQDLLGEPSIFQGPWAKGIGTNYVFAPYEAPEKSIAGVQTVFNKRKRPDAGMVMSSNPSWVGEDASFPSGHVIQPPPVINPGRGALVYNWTNQAAATSVRYTVQISTDRGRQWKTVAVKNARPSIEIDPTWIKDADTLTVRVKAIDGFKESVATSVPLDLTARVGPPAGQQPPQ